LAALRKVVDRNDSQTPSAYVPEAVRSTHLVVEEEHVSDYASTCALDTEIGRKVKETRDLPVFLGDGEGEGHCG
jgi:hypothetical protein